MGDIPPLEPSHGAPPKDQGTNQDDSLRIEHLVQLKDLERERELRKEIALRILAK